MKKFYKAITVISLSAALVAAAAGCKGKTSSESDDAPFTYSFSLDKEKESYTLTGYTISAEAKSLAEKNDYEALAKLFNDYLGEEKFDAKTVRTFTVPETYKDPDTEKEYRVTKVAANAVVNLSYIDNVVVKDNVEELGLGSFAGLTSLAEITLPFVGKSANDYYYTTENNFGYIFGTAETTGLTSCTQVYNDGDSSNSATYYIPTTLKKVTVTGNNEDTGTEKTIRYKIDEDGNKVKAEENETEDEDVIKETFPVYKNAVGPYAFYGCTTIESVSLEGEYNVIYEYTFASCSSLKTFAVPESVGEIKAYAFDDCSAMYKIDLNNVETIGDGAFEHCSALGTYAFAGNEYVLQTKATSVGEGAFGGCTSLESVRFTADTEIGDKAFENCTALKKATFDASAKIGRYAFKGCEDVTIDGTPTELVDGDETWRENTDKESM